jgi:hypothetical protein
MPNVGDTVEVLFMLGGSIVHHAHGIIRAVNGADVEIDLGQPTPLPAQASKLTSLGPNEWELRMQFKEMI